MIIINVTSLQASLPNLFNNFSSALLPLLVPVFDNHGHYEESDVN